MIGQLVVVLTLLFFVVIDILFRITTLSNRVYSIDKEIYQILNEFKDQDFDEDPFKRKGQEQGEFNYYKECFTLTKRNGDWRYIPSNTLAKGDIIMILPGEKAPAMLKRVQIINGKLVKYELEEGNNDEASAEPEISEFQAYQASEVNFSNAVMSEGRIESNEMPLG